MPDVGSSPLHPFGAGGCRRRWFSWCSFGRRCCGDFFARGAFGSDVHVDLDLHRDLVSTADFESGAAEILSEVTITLAPGTCAYAAGGAFEVAFLWGRLASRVDIGG